MTLTLTGLTGDRTMLVLAACPGDESLACGGLIAEACARGRPPLVAVLSDGASLGAPGVSGDIRAVAHERETRAAVRALGLPPGRLLMLGVLDGAVPAEGGFFEQVVDAVGFLTWMRDLNVVCGPRPDDRRPLQARAGRIAATIASRVGTGLLRYGEGTDAREWAVGAHAAAKARAVAAHASLGVQSGPGTEWFAIEAGDRHG